MSSRNGKKPGHFKNQGAATKTTKPIKQIKKVYALLLGKTLSIKNLSIKLAIANNE